MRYLSRKNRTILREMVVTDFKVRYQGSLLGYLWSVLKPLFLFAILYIIFTYVFKVGKGIPHYPVYLLLGIILWNFFTEATIVGASSVVSHGDLIRKISIPRYLVVAASSVSALINLCFSLVAALIIALFNGLRPELSWLLLPLLFLELFALALAVAFILAAAYVKYRDVSYIWEILLQAGFYASAILFPLQLVPVQYQKWFFVNPIVQIVQDARYLGVTHDTITIWSKVGLPFVAYPFLVIIAVAVVAKFYFKKQSRLFAENI
ncbi:MAG TPA: ABC transporter permease [Candidatus Saccharimonadales bacterium]|nr:ABC transporter permease [Candidatus Saccharimonadales bacterium]